MISHVFFPLVIHALAGSFCEIPCGHSRYQGFFSPRQKKKDSIKDILAAHRWSPKVLSIGYHITGPRSCCPNSCFLTWCAPPSEGLLSVTKLSSSGMTGVSISNNETIEKMLWKEALGSSNNPSSHLLSRPGVKQEEAGLFETECASRSIRGDIFPSFYLADATQRAGIIIFA